MIGGSGLYSLAEVPGYNPKESRLVETRWGPPSAPVSLGSIGGRPVAFLPRHGTGHSVAPHRINYRANVEALRLVGVDRVLAVGAVGGIGAACVPGAVVVPDQLIDYTHGREATFSGPSDAVDHVDFTDPYSPEWRDRVIAALRGAGGREGSLVIGGTYGATQGPRFETAAEVSRLARDGCTVVGMTGMPEAILAREAGLEYAVACPVGNLAAGINPVELDQDEVTAVARAALPLIAASIPALA
ncbi:MAG: S-methyl-5'-thioinosine phosphorylase [Actinomycetota bacterium]|nr:S-methyl-5'-thioinosine phosphorylase [Actinomycetota bacterium]